MIQLKISFEKFSWEVIYWPLMRPYTRTSNIGIQRISNLALEPGHRLTRVLSLSYKMYSGIASSIAFFPYPGVILITLRHM